MSTKSTLKCSNKKGKDYHFYEECFDGKSVYLNIRNTSFEAHPSSITIEIPREIWNEIVKIGEIPIVQDDNDDWDIDLTTINNHHQVRTGSPKSQATSDDLSVNRNKGG